MKEKIIKNLAKNWKFYLIVFFVVIAFWLMSFYALGVSDRLYKKSDEIIADNQVNDIAPGTKVEEKIVCEENNFQRVDIQFEPFKDKNDIGGKVTIGINDSDGNVIHQETITRNNIRENSTYEFKFKNQKNSKDKEYTLWIQFEEIEEGKQFFSVKTSDSKIAIQEFYLSNKMLAFFVLVALAFTIYAVGISIYIRNKKDIKIERIFLYTVPVICLFYILVMPTFKNHDELYHWFRAYEVSSGHLMEKIDGDTLGTELPKSIASVQTDDWTTIAYSDVADNLGVALNPDDKTLLYSETSAVYSFVQYIPQAVGIAIARIFTDKVLLLAYAGRIMNMIVSMACIYLAIKKIPFGKKFILLLCFIPIAIEGFSSLSPDAMTISIAFLYIAYVLSLAFNKKDAIIEKKQFVILTALSVVMALCKIVYLPLVLLMFIIPKEKFTNNKKMKPLIIITAIAVVINLAWLAVSGMYLSHFREGDSALQVKSVLLHPIRYIQDCLYTLNINGQDYLYTMFGGELGWGELVKIYSIVPYTLFILAIWITIADESVKEKFKLYQKLIIAFVLIAITALIFTSLYVQWTTPGSDSILGIQGRYFIPILPLLMLLVGSQLKVKTEYKGKDMSKLIAISGTLLQICVIVQIMICHL